MESETEFLLRRASEESLKAIASGQPEAADAHEELAVRYSAKAIMGAVRLTRTFLRLADGCL